MGVDGGGRGCDLVELYATSAGAHASGFLIAVVGSAAMLGCTSFSPIRVTLILSIRSSTAGGGGVGGGGGKN